MKCNQSRPGFVAVSISYDNHYTRDTSTKLNLIMRPQFWMYRKYGVLLHPHPLFPGSFGPGVVVCVKIPSMHRIELFSHFLRIIITYLKSFNWVKSFVLDMNTWYHVTVCRYNITQEELTSRFFRATITSDVIEMTPSFKTIKIINSCRDPKSLSFAPVIFVNRIIRSINWATRILMEVVGRRWN